ncbi:MAG: nuclear transport factor 2 family protein [Myxococcota bacterium]
MHRALFEDDLEMDFSVSIGGGGIQRVKADDWVKGAAAFFGALDATQHDLIPYKIVIEDNAAYVSVMLHAQHYLKNDWGEPVQIMVGTHNFWMRRHGDTWKIHKVIEELSWNEGNYKVFELAVEESGAGK